MDDIEVEIIDCGCDTVSAGGLSPGDYVLRPELYGVSGALQYEIDNITVGSVSTGSLVNNFYPLVLNPANYTMSGNLTGVSGVLQNQINNFSTSSTGGLTGEFVRRIESGVFYSIINPNNYANSGNLFNSGSNLFANDTILSGKLISLSGGVVLVYGDQAVNGIKTFQNNVAITANLEQGLGNTVLGSYGHSEGRFNLSSGSFSHTEGDRNTAIGSYSHAEGESTTSIGLYSHSEGFGTIASGDGQLTIGRYNLPDTTSLFIVGNGLNSAGQSNVFKVFDSGVIIGSGNRIDFDSNYKSLSGQWQTNNLPVQSGDIVNKFYLDQRTGVLYPIHNPNNYSNSGNLYQTGANLLLLITAASAGVSSLNGASGILNIVGVGNNTVTTNGQTITVSGITGSLTGEFVRRSDSGQFYSIQNLNNYISSGGTGNLIGRWETGRFYSIENINNYSTTGDLNTSSGILQTQIDLERLSPRVTGMSILGAIPRVTGDIVLTPGNDILIGQGAGGFTFVSTAASVASVSNTTKLQVSGSSYISGGVAITGLGTVRVTISGQTIDISGVATDLSSYATTSNLTNTGITLLNQIVSLSGDVQGTGTNLLNRIGILSGQVVYTNQTGGFYRDNINSFSTSGNVANTGADLLSRHQLLSGNVTSTGINLEAQLRNIHASGITGISVSGGATMTGFFNFNPGSNITLTQLGLTGITISSSAGGSSSPTTGDSSLFIVNQNSHGFLVGEVLRISGVSGNIYSRACANFASFAEVVGVVSVVLDSNNFNLLTHGLVKTGIPLDYSPGTVLFLSDTISGRLTGVEPTNIGSISKPLSLITASGSGMVFNNMRGIQITNASPSNIFSGIYITGSNLIQNYLNISGAGNVIVKQNNQTLIISGSILTGTNEIYIPAGAITPSVVGGAITGTIVTGGMTFDVLDFSQTPNVSGFFNLTFPQKWNNSKVKGQFYWTETGTTGTVVWGLDGCAVKNNQYFNIQYGQAQLVTGSFTVGGQMHQATTDYLTISGNPTNADMCFFKVYRNSGSFVGNSRLLGISLQYYDTGISTSIY